MATTNKTFRVKTGLTVEGQSISTAAGTTSYPPILMTSGTNLTSATAGAFEYDGTNFYLTPSTTRKTISFTDHVHGNITSAGAIGSTANLVAVTTTAGALTTATSTNQSSSTFLRGDLTWVTPTDTNWYPTAVTMTAGTTAGPTVNLTMSGTTNITGSAIPSASASASGVVTTTAQTFTGVKTFNYSPVVPTPINGTDAANKAYVDATAAGIHWKESVRVATTVPQVLTTDFFAGQVIDGVTLVTGDRILIKNQSDTTQNGIYVVPSAGTPSRASDADTGAELSASMAVFVEEGSQADSGWTLTNNGTIVIGSSSLSFTQFTGLGQVTAGAGLTKTGNTIDIVGTSDRIYVNADSIDIASTYVGQTSITTLGTVTTGTWNGSTIAVAKGGSGATTLTGFLKGNGTSPFTAVSSISLTADVSGTLPVANGGTGITAFGTGVATALGNATGGTGGFVTFSGAMGTPTSITLTNATGLPVSTGISGLGSGVATFLATPTSANLLAAVSDETGTGSLVFAGSPALTGTPTLDSNAAFIAKSGSTTGTTALTLSSIYSSSTYNGGEFIVKATNGSNIEITKILVVTDGSNVYVTNYGDVYISSSIVNIDFTYTTTNVNMVITPVAGTTGTTSVKVSGTLLAV